MRDRTGKAIEDEAVRAWFSDLLLYNENPWSYPCLHSWLFSSSPLIIPIIISSLTRPPWSMIFLASRPSDVFLATWDRSISPVALNTIIVSKENQSAMTVVYRLTRWQAQYFSFILGACVPLPRGGLKDKEITVWHQTIPAPGGPIKIIRIPAVAFCLRVEPPPVVCSSLDSNCSTRVSSFRTKSRRASTEASSIGAIASCKDCQKAGPRQKERSVGAKPYGQRLVIILV